MPGVCTLFVMQGEELSQILKAQTFSVLTILYNCVQKEGCLLLFVSTKHLSTSLVSIASSPDLEVRFLSKLVLGFLSLILTTEQHNVLIFQPDEALYVLSSLSNISGSSEDTADGYSADELLQGLLNFSEVKENLLVCLDPAMLRIFNAFLKCNNRSCHNLILQIVWNILTATDEHIREMHSRLIDVVPAIEMLSVTPEIKVLHHCVLILFHQRGAENGMIDSESKAIEYTLLVCLS